ncbi:GNAT family N-acetyltransferase [Kribbella sp. NPDC020789]
MDRASLQAAADRNVAAALRHFAAHAAGAAIVESPALLRVAAAVPFAGAFHNAALRLDPTADAGSAVEALRSFAAEWRRDMVLWAATHRDQDLIQAAVDAGLRVRSSAVGMVAHEPPGPPVAPSGVEVERVVDVSGVAAFGAVHESLGRDAAVVGHFGSVGALLAPDAAGFVVRADGRPVACAMTVVSGHEAGVYWVATCSDSRRRGYGELATRAAVRAGFEHGARVVTLQSTEQGLPLYRKLGFEPFTTYPRYVAPGPPPLSKPAPHSPGTRG